MKQTACIIILATIALSCNSGYKTKYPYTIKDYSNSLQPSLVEALTMGLPGYDRAYRVLNEHASTKELKKLALCEHPSLRMLALRALIWRKGIDHYPIIMDHLDDSAMVATDEGEWGIGMKRVTDFMLEDASWETEEKRNEAVDILLLHHNNFHCAYSILRLLPPEEKYYASVKEMVQREDRRYETETEYALWYLAQFNRKEDVPLIAKILKRNDSWIENYSFKIMEQYPDERYMEILEYYARVTLWRDLQSDDYHYFRVKDFYKALAVYRNEKAAILFSSILKRLPEANNCNAYYSTNDNSYLYEAICDNSCEAFRDLIPIVEPYVMEDLCNRIYFEPDTTSYKKFLDIEESKEKFNWFQ